MLQFSLLVIIFISRSQAQLTRNQNNNLLSVTIEDENLDDSITQIFNQCKCVIFYLCDEQNFIIPPEELDKTKAAPNYPLRRVKRLRCSNEFYYCCKNRTSAVPPATTTFRPPTEKPRPNPITCGRSPAGASRVAEEFPWAIAIFERKRYANSVYNFKCGGALVHPRVVLTAQHCVRASTANSIMITAGRENVTQYSRTALSRRVAKIIKHNQYNSGALYNDIALLILKSPLENTAPVCLPTPGQNFDRVRCVVAGWGSIDQRTATTLRKLDLPVVDSQRCQFLLRRTALGAGFTLHPSFLCAGGEQDKDTCKGDGGSPLMCLENRRYVQIGIVSWGLECGQRDVPSMYTNVAQFSNWIEEVFEQENLVTSRYG